MTPHTSLSSLPLLAICPGSASLPRTASVSAESRFGDAGHEMLSRRVGGYNEGSTFDLARLTYVHDLARLTYVHDLEPPHARDLATIARLLRLPVPAGALAEVALGLFEDGSVRRIEGGKGRYEDVPGLLLPGTIDAMWAEPEPFGETPGGGPESWPYCHPGSVLWICDWKLGSPDNVAPVERNRQIRAAALLAARWTGATRVIPALCYLDASEALQAQREGREYQGRWDVEMQDGAPRVFGVEELAGIEREVRGILSAAGIGGENHEQTDAGGVYGSGQDGRGVAGRPPENTGAIAHSGRAAGVGGPVLPPRLVTGSHCDHCAAAGACPAWGGLVRSGLERGSNLSREGATPGRELRLTPAERPHLLAMMRAARRFADAAQVMLRAGGPVELPGGKVYAPALEEQRELDAGIVLGVLAAEVDDDAATMAAEVTWASVKRALEGVDKATRARVYEAIEEAGGVTVTWTERWRERQEEARDARREEEGDRGIPARHVEAEPAPTPDAVHARVDGHLVPNGGGRAAQEEERPVVGHETPHSSLGVSQKARVVGRRGTCAHCGRVDVALNSNGRPRKHEDAREPDALIRRRGCAGMQTVAAT